MVGTLAASFALTAVIIARSDDVPDRGHVTKEHTHLENNLFGKKYVTDVIQKDTWQRPYWDEEDEDNPPISARRALKLARKVRDSVATIPDDYGWVVREISLLQMGDWVWAVTFDAHQKLVIGPLPEIEPAERNAITILVFMDGTTIRPVVANEK